MPESPENQFVTLDYSRAENDRRPAWTAAAFWVVYAACALVGLVALEPMVAIKLFGRPGDRVVGAFVLASTGVVTAVAGLLYWACLRHRPPYLGLVVAAVIGLGNFVPAYAVLFLFF